jgi:hypothetical protein
MSWKEVALALGALAFAVLTLEMTFRMLPAVALGYHYENEVFGRPHEFELHTELNRFGCHDIEYGPKQPGVRRVLLLGDSFVQGASVPIAETLPRRLEDQLEEVSSGRYDVVSLAGPGFGPREELNLLEWHGRELAPDLVISLFLPEDDVMVGSPALVSQRKEQLRALAKRSGPTMFRIHADDARLLFIRGSELNRWISHRLTLVSLRREREEIPTGYVVWAKEVPHAWQEAWRAVESLYSQTQALAAELGAGYAMVSATSTWAVRGTDGLEQLMSVYPAMRDREWDLEEPERHMARFCADQDIPFLSLLPAFRRETLERGRQLHWRYDGHWNPEGNDLAARLIAEFIEEIDAAAVEPETGARREAPGARLPSAVH